jgi:hypothetical protein
MACKYNSKPGADRIPTRKLEEVNRLLIAGDKAAAGKLLDSLCVKHQLKSYEAHQLAAHLLKEASAAQDTDRHETARPIEGYTHEIKCDHCGKAATCVEVEGREQQRYSCDKCCGHGSGGCRLLANENPCWTACRTAIRKEPCAFEFLLWNEAMLNEFSRAVKVPRGSLDFARLVGHGDQYDQWLKARATELAADKC